MPIDVTDAGKIVMNTPDGLPPYDCFQKLFSGSEIVVNASAYYWGSLSVDCKQGSYDPAALGNLLHAVRAVDHAPIVTRLENPNSTDLQLRSLIFDTMGGGNATVFAPLVHVRKPTP